MARSCPTSPRTSELKLEKQITLGIICHAILRVHGQRCAAVPHTMDFLHTWLSSLTGVAAVAVLALIVQWRRQRAALRRRDAAAQAAWKPIAPRTEPVPLPGNLWAHDFRNQAPAVQDSEKNTHGERNAEAGETGAGTSASASAGASTGSGSGSGGGSARKQMRVVVWNIERGQKIARVIEELRRLNADVILLQEVDIACRRSHGVDVGAEIAAALRMNLVYVCQRVVAAVLIQAVVALARCRG